MFVINYPLLMDIHTCHLQHLTKGDTVGPLNKGHFGTAPFVLCKEGVFFRRNKMYKNHMKDVSWDSS